MTKGNPCPKAENQKEEEFPALWLQRKLGWKSTREQQGDLDWMQVRRRTKDGRRACT